MVDVLLIHGSCFGAWAWDAVIPALQTMGHRVRAMDLPGRDGKPTSLAAQAQAIADVLDGPTVLVCHSAGGFAISAAAHLSAHVSGLIFVAAYIPDGRSLADMRRAGPSHPMRGAFEITPDRQAYRFAPNRCTDLFFHDCVDPIGATARLCFEPIAPQETQQAAPPPLPSAAIICTQDRAIPADYQTRMAQGLPQTTLLSGHCPFLSMPGRLADSLGALLNQMENPTHPVAG